MSGPVSFHIGTSTGSTVAMAMASKASKNVATPTMIRVLTCHHEVGSRSIRATTLSTAPAGAAEPMLMTSSPVFAPIILSNPINVIIRPVASHEAGLSRAFLA